jgi:hypothetical protein
MSAKEFSGYQQDIISNYYGNLETIMLGKLSELVSELYLAKTPQRKKLLWERAHKAMKKLKIRQGLIDHIIGKQDVEILAKNLQDWLAQKTKK